MKKLLVMLGTAPRMERSPMRNRWSQPWKSGLHDVRWVALGAMAGAGFALLVAPARGEESRAALRRRAREIGDAVAHEGRAIASQRQRVSAAVHRGYEQAAAFGGRVEEARRAAYQDIRDRVKQSVGHLQRSS
jgi:gas vesicle protein